MSLFSKKEDNIHIVAVDRLLNGRTKFEAAEALLFPKNTGLVDARFFTAQEITDRRSVAWRLQWSLFHHPPSP